MQLKWITMDHLSSRVSCSAEADLTGSLASNMPGEGTRDEVMPGTSGDWKSAGLYILWWLMMLNDG